MTALLNKIRLPNSNSKTPIVYILGWGGSRDKQLGRYSEIYENRGFDVTRYIPPFGKLNGRSFIGYGKYALDFYERALAEVKNDVDRPIVFHALSMNGISVFVKLWDLLADLPDGHLLKKRVRGIVFDSGPSDTIPWTSAIALSLATFPPGRGFLSFIGRYIFRLVIYCFTAISRLLQWLKFITIDPLIWEREVAYYRLFKLKDLPSKQLYLYSKADTLIRSKEVDRFIEHQKSLGADVQSKCWVDSPHVQHLKYHPDEYQTLCYAFLDKILEKSKI